MEKPIVGIVLGSDSDLPIMEETARILQEFGVSYEMTIASAHRSPELAAEYARTAEERGLAVIISGAGMAAHLPGVLAAYSCLPMIGVPLKGGALSGLDALYSVVQMPPGVPVAAVAVDGARNAALLAIQMLSIKDMELRERFRDYKQELAKKTAEKAEKLKTNYDLL
jgi:5-(carboxyamino)imidazole ribonucleotide mutase